MAKYTMTLQYMIECEDYYPIVRNYPIFNESYRKKLNDKIVEHFWFREIGFETKEIFRDRIGVKLNEIMPYYNQLYLSELIEFNPLHNVDLTETSNRDTSGIGNSDADAKSNRKGEGSDNLVHAFSATPQGVNSESDIRQFTFVTNTDYDINKRNSVDDATSNQTSQTQYLNEEEFWRRLVGNNGASYPSKLIQEFRETFLNIDMQIIADLQSLFMGIY